MDTIPVTTNSQGFRYYENVPFNKPNNEYRIFTVGNSSAFGVGVIDGESFTAQLEKLLREKYGQMYKVRAVNAACPGYTTYQNLIELKTMILPFHPDLVIVANNNDAGLEYVEEKARACRIPFLCKLNTVLYKSEFYLLFRRLVLDSKLGTLGKNSRMDNAKLVSRVSLDDYQANIRQMAEIAKSHNFKIIFVNMPVNYDTLAKFPYLRESFYKEAYQDVLVRFCEANNQILADVDNIWKIQKQKGLFDTAYYNGIKSEAHFHPSAKGHRKIAEQLYGVILENKLIH